MSHTKNIDELLRFLKETEPVQTKAQETSNRIIAAIRAEPNHGAQTGRIIGLRYLSAAVAAAIVSFFILQTWNDEPIRPLSSPDTYASEQWYGAVHQPVREDLLTAGLKYMNDLEQEAYRSNRLLSCFLSQNLTITYQNLQTK